MKIHLQWQTGSGYQETIWSISEQNLLYYRHVVWEQVSRGWLYQRHCWSNKKWDHEFILFQGTTITHHYNLCFNLGQAMYKIGQLYLTVAVIDLWSLQNENMVGLLMSPCLVPIIHGKITSCTVWWCFNTWLYIFIH